VKTPAPASAATPDKAGTGEKPPCRGLIDPDVVFFTLFGVQIVIYAVKLVMLATLMAEDYDAYASGEAMFFAFAGVPTLMATSGMILLDRASKRRAAPRRLTVRSLILTIAFAAFLLLELIPALFYFMGAAASVDGLLAAVSLAADVITYPRRLRRRLAEEAREAKYRRQMSQTYERAPAKKTARTSSKTPENGKTSK
jgi:small-conductance mechanosensitive channel